MFSMVFGKDDYSSQNVSHSVRAWARESSMSLKAGKKPEHTLLLRAAWTSQLCPKCLITLPNSVSRNQISLKETEAVLADHVQRWTDLWEQVWRNLSSTT